MSCYDTARGDVVLRSLLRQYCRNSEGSFVADLRKATRVTSAGRLLVLTSGAFVCAHASVDPDLWGHVRFGADTLRNGGVSSLDPYSFAQDMPWVNHEWLSEIVQALAYRAGGVAGLLVLKALLLFAAFALLARAVRTVPEPYRWWALAAGIIAIAPAGYTIRPQLWTLLLLPVLWLALRHPRSVLFVPLVFGLWANLHGGWIVGLAVAVLWFIGAIVDDVVIREKPDAPDRRWVPAVAIGAGLAATLVNPYGWRLWMFLLSTVRTSRNIGEWRPIWQQPDATEVILWLLVTLVVAVPAVSRRAAGFSWAGALPVAWLAVMSLFVARLVPIFGEVAVLAHTAVRRSADRPDRTPTARRLAPFVVVDAVVVAAVALVNLIPQSRCLPITGPWAPDLHAAGAFESSSIHGHVVLPFDWGEYAIWHWGPRLRVSDDGRRETVYSEGTMRMQAAMEHGQPEGVEYVRRVRPEYVWLRNGGGGALATTIAAAGYRVDVATRDSFIATRPDLPALQPGRPMPRCFP
jgi:hypothetical protein